MTDWFAANWPHVLLVAAFLLFIILFCFDRKICPECYGDKP